MRRAALSLFLFACGTSPAKTDAGADGSTSDVIVAPLDGTPGDCSDQAKRVYLVSTQNDLWSFDPGTLAFQKIGALDCPTTSTPESLGVDRTARAWVAMMDGALFQVDTSTAHCTPTSYALAQNERKIFDLAFSTTGSTETLFSSTTCCYDDAGGVTVTNHGGGGLATIAMPSLSLSLVGDYTGLLAGYPCALAGTGDGRLFGFFPSVNDPDGASRRSSRRSTERPAPRRIRSCSRAPSTRAPRLRSRSGAATSGSTPRIPRARRATSRASATRRTSRIPWW